MKEFYRSAAGLKDNYIVLHPFKEPVELLARCRRLYVRTDSLGRLLVSSGKQELLTPLPRDVSQWLSCLRPRDISLPKKFNRLQIPRCQRRKSLSQVLGWLLENYRITPLIREYLLFVEPSYLIHPDYSKTGLSLETLQVIEMEETLRYATSLPAKDRKRVAYFKRLTRLDAIRTAFDCVALTYQKVRRERSNQGRYFFPNLTLLSHRLWSDPWKVCKELKALATECRAYYFRAVPRPVDPLVSFLNEKEMLEFSYIARSLPSPQVSKEEAKGLIDDFHLRLLQPAPDEPSDWRDFIRRWLKLNRGKGEISLYAEPSVNAGLGYSAKRWGHSAAYRDIICYQLGTVCRSDSPPYNKLLYYILNTIREEAEPIVYGPRFHIMDSALDTSLLSARVLNRIMLDGCESILNVLLTNPVGENGEAVVLPALPIVAPEKGMKIRLPTMGLTAANIVQQAFRKAADHFLLNDPRSSSSLGGDQTVDLSGASGSWYSQDLTFATDCHGFWAQRVLYEELLPYCPPLRRWERFIPMLFGPRRLLNADNFKSCALNHGQAPELLTVKIVPRPGVITRNGLPLRMYSRFFNNLPQYKDTPLFEEQKVDLSMHEGLLPFDFFPGFSRKDGKNYFRSPPPDFSKDIPGASTGIRDEPRFLFFEAWDDCDPELRFSNSFSRLMDYIQDMFPHPNYKMGEPTFDLPIQDFEYRRSNVAALSPNDLIDYANRYDIWVLAVCSLPHSPVTKRGAMMGEPTSWAVLPLVSFYALEKADRYLAITTGDDALVPEMDQSSRMKYDAALQSLGGIVSKPKSFLHPTRGLFCEVPYVNGSVRKHDKLSFWVAPKGGTKGEVNWYNLVSAFSGELSQQGVASTRANLVKRGLFQFTKFVRVWQAAREMNLPLGAPEFMGGINHPTLRDTPSKFLWQWFAYLSSIPLEKLILYGGLSLVPMLDKTSLPSVELQYKVRLSKLPNDPDGIPIKDAVASLRNPASSLSIFSRSWIGKLAHAPSTRALSQRFNRRIRRTPVILRRGKVPCLKDDLKAKMSRKISQSGSFRYFGGRVFGLIQNSKELGPVHWGRRPYNEGLG